MAPMSTDIGVVIITAPTVPPRTIISAVGDMISRIFPPSRMRPRTIPPIPRARPPIVAKSSFEPDLLAIVHRIIHLVVGERTVAKSLENGAAELDHLRDNLLAALADADLLPCRQCDDGIGCRFEIFDQIRVQHEGFVTASGQVNH